ncbi:ExeA family protein [Sedimenticola selenatireducens]|uniref:ExeA family protein n=1 Tax=Sedimenticola selenatireducens TaxID=191960 RepID=UPI000A0134EE|nr:AAA family ATPase [Sedimenticola selenatireducens]
MHSRKLYEEGWEAHRRRKPTPLKCKRILGAICVPQSELARYLVLAKGAHPSEATLAQILNRDLWPARSPKSLLQQQIRAFLRHQGVSEEDIEVAFEIDEEDRYQPRSTHQDLARIDIAPAPTADEDQLPETVMLSQIARNHFRLFRSPFQDDVQGPDDVFLAPDQRYIREYMFNTARHGGFLAVVGESGAGKSVLRRDLIDRIYREGHEITPILPRIIDKARLTAGAVCDAIIEDISQERPRRSLEAKGRQIEQLLTGSSRSGSSHVLIIEEAHDLTVHTLKYLKRFWELEDGFRRLLSIILIGQSELKSKLDERQNWQAREVIRRIEVAELVPLNSNLEEYLGLKFKRMDKSLTDVFEADAFEAIRKRLTLRHRNGRDTISMLYPLVVNNLVVKCMNLAAEIGEGKITADVVAGV